MYVDLLYVAVCCMYCMLIEEKCMLMSSHVLGFNNFYMFVVLIESSPRCDGLWVILAVRVNIRVPLGY